MLPKQLKSTGIHFSAEERQSPQLARKLRVFAPNWSLITQDRWVLETIQGYSIDLRAEPYQVQRPCPPVLDEVQLNFLRVELTSLLKKGVLSPVPASESLGGFYSNLFLVPKKIASRGQ